MRRAAVLAAVVGVGVALGVALAGCRGGDDAGPPTTAGTSTTRPAESAVVAAATTVPSADVFTALTGDDPAALARVLPATEPGSPAAHYVDYLAAARAVTDTPGCGAACPAYSAAEFDPTSGRLSGFAVDGEALSGRVSGPGIEVTVDSLTMHVAGAYLTAADDLFVVLAAGNSGADAAELFGFAAVFQPAGSTTAADVSAWWGDPVVPVGGRTQVLLKFAGAGVLGGTLSMSGVAGGGIDLAAAVEVPAT